MARWFKNIQIDNLPGYEQGFLGDEVFCKIHRHKKWWNKIEHSWVVSKKGIKVLKCRWCIKVLKINKEIRKEKLKKVKKELPDFYILKIITHRRELKVEDIPKEMIDTVRDIVKLKEFVKIFPEQFECKKHNLKGREYFNKSGNKKFKCKECQKEQHKKHYHKNKVQILKSHQLYMEMKKNAKNKEY
jgi:hypothetical protein